MTETEIIALVNSSLAEEFELDAEIMTPEASFQDDFGLDSLDAVDMVIVLEQAFGFKIKNNDEIKRIRTLGDLHAYVIAKKNAVEAETVAG